MTVKQSMAKTEVSTYSWESPLLSKVSKWQKAKK